MRRNVCLSDIALNELRQSCFVYENCFVFFFLVAWNKNRKYNETPVPFT